MQYIVCWESLNISFSSIIFVSKILHIVTAVVMGILVCSLFVFILWYTLVLESFAYLV